MQKLEGKWVVVKPWSELFYLGVARVLFVHKETAKQIKASESPSHTAYHDITTVSKIDVIGVIPEGSVVAVRQAAEETAEEYQRKRDALFSDHYNKMKSVADQFEGEKYEIDNK